jgi:peptidoglycan lytic transglycosylase G
MSERETRTSTRAAEATVDTDGASGAPEPRSAPGRGASIGAFGGGGLRGAVRRHPLRAAIGALAVVLVGLIAWAAAWYESAAAGAPGGARTIVDVPTGASVSAITALLARQQVVDSSLAFHIYLTLSGTPVVRPGGYYMRRHEDFASVKRSLATGPDVFEVSLPPGFTVYEVAQAVGEVPGHHGSAFLSLATSGAVHSPWQPAGSTNLDGLLGTGTYVILPGESDETLLEQMVQRFDTEADRAGLPQAAAALGITPYQAVTVASIVQEEGVYPQNLAKVARVIYNRLARGMHLQMDSTVLYSEHRDGGPVTSADLNLDTPYNTYLHPGLTPSPIAFPSLSSLRATLSPATGEWLYFVVVSKDGTEAFSDTLAGQNANEQLAKSRGLP